jgi:potassium-dependent mechanosensitive channel
MTLAHTFLKSVPLFEKCDDGTLQRIALGLRWHTYKKGDTVLFQGMISHQMYLVASGRVAIFTRKDGQTRQVATLREGEYFGEISLLTNRAATATVKAEDDDTQVYILDRDGMVTALASHPDVLEDVTRRIRERNQNRQDAFQKVEAAA